MKCLLFLSYLVIMISGLQAQNLVPNPSFEEVDSLHCFFITGDIGSPFVDNYIQEWTTPTGGTSDLHSILLPDSCLMNPSKLNISPRAGSNFIGIYTVEASGNYREYIQVELSSHLEKDKIYYAEMFVRRNPSFPFAGSNLGIHFSDFAIQKSTEFREVLNFSPQILEKEIILEDKEWVKISGCFKSASEATHLTIGNFFSTEETTTAFLSESGQFSAYYFIDDVYVGEVAPSADLGNDTTLCAGETLLLDASNEGAVSYTWLDFFNEPTFLVEEAGTYWVDINYGQCTFRDSITVSYEPAISLGPDTLLCEGESLLLDASHPNGAYLWSDGSTASRLEVTEAGTYHVSIPSDNCLLSDTIEVSYAECPGFIPNVFTPGNDEQNETFYIANIENREWQLRIFNRWGREVYNSPNYQNDWDGEGLSSGMYLYHLYSPSLQKEYKGWVEIKRNAIFLQNTKPSSQ